MKICKRLLSVIFLIFYRMVAMRLPHSYWPAGWMFSAIRRFALIGMGCKVGRGCELEPGIDVGFRPRLQIGERCQINQNTMLKTVCLGNDVMIAPGVVMLDRQHNYSDVNIPMSMQGSSSRKLTNVGNDVWIGQNVIIMPGVSIGNGVVVGAGSVVTKDLPDWSVAVGVPAKVIRYRKVVS